LDRAYRQTRGQIEGKEASIPRDVDIEEYFEQVSESLIAQGTKPMSGDAKDKALAYLIRFNRQMGDVLYPKVRDTEHRLQSQSDEFVMEGIVDVLVREDGEEDDPSTWEIWDYMTMMPICRITGTRCRSMRAYSRRRMASIRRGQYCISLLRTIRKMPGLRFRSTRIGLRRRWKPSVEPCLISKKAGIERCGRPQTRSRPKKRATRVIYAGTAP